jgi:hypothetical protein
MSVWMTIHTPRRTIKVLEKIIHDWANSYQGQPKIRIIVSHFSSPDHYYIFGEGSIRGFSLTPSSSFLKGGQIQIRLSVMASLADWRYCYSLLAFLSHTPRVTIYDEESEMILASSLTDSGAAERGSKALQGDYKFLKGLIIKNNEPNVQLPNPWFDLVVTREDLTEISTSDDGFMLLEKKLIEMASPLGFCRHANQILMKDGATLNAIWFEPAIYQETDYAILVKKNSLGLPFSEAEMSFVKFKDFLDIFQDKIQQVKEKPACYYFSGIDRKNDQEFNLYEKLTNLGQDKLPRKQ